MVLHAQKPKMRLTDQFQEVTYTFFGMILSIFVFNFYKTFVHEHELLHDVSLSVSDEKTVC